MSVTLALLAAGAVSAALPIETTFGQVAPQVRDDPYFVRSADKTRAVVLIHGLKAHLFSSTNVTRPEPHRWQRPGSTLVTTLAREADVYAFAYSQQVPIERIAESARLDRDLRRLKRLGYEEIILVGHSAGGLVARLFVEDHPNVGVTKVIQVCTPNGGSSWAQLSAGVRDIQEPFLKSLTKTARQQCLEQRGLKQIPAGVEFICVVGQLSLRTSMAIEKELGDQGPLLPLLVKPRLKGDGLVACDCQWSKDLQDQGIPAVLMDTAHFWVMHTKAGADTVARLLRDKQPRWDAERIAATRQEILNTVADKP